MSVTSVLTPRESRLRSVFRRVRTLWVVAILGVLPAWLAAQRDIKPTVILISFDGFRWDYVTKAPMPNLQTLIARGVRADNLISSFPSKTFPNHYSIVTGLYPEHHGIVANNIRDAHSGRTFAMAKQSEVRDPMWWGGEPIWVTAQRAGQRSGTMFWPGSEAPIKGVLPTFWKPYLESLPGNARVDQVLEWIDRPDSDRPTLLTAYFEDTDTAGHQEGPDSKAVQDAIRRVDGYLGRLLRGLERRKLLDRVNLVIVSDHGMASVDSKQVVVLDDYISLTDVEIADINPTIGLFPQSGKMDAVYGALKNAHPRLHVYRREETPSEWHYRDHPRIPPIVGVVDEGWQVVRRATVIDIATQKIRPARGQHGYDPMAMSMRGIFIAAGPAFKQHVTVPAFHNVNIYSTLAAVLNIQPAANDGDSNFAKQVLR